MLKSHMLEIKNLTIELFNKPLVENLSFVLNKGDKVGVIGEEGTGKSTLLKTIYSKELVSTYSTISGEILRKDLKIGYLEQSLNTDWNNISVLNFFLKENPKDKINLDKYSEFNKIEEIFSKLKISKDFLKKKKTIKTLSGGEKVKIQIAKILLKEPDVFLFDEPTNDLDLETLGWLENFIKEIQNPVIFVSHDETLLENVANCVLHIEKVKKDNILRHTFKRVGYATYIEEREQEFEKQKRISDMEYREYKKDKKIFSRRKSIVRSKQINILDSTERRILNKRMRNILVQEKRIEKKRVTERPEVLDPIYISLDSDVEIPKGKDVLKLRLKELKVKNKILAKNIELFVTGSEKVGIVGENGIGKTTLLKKILEVLEKDFEVGYMPQNYNEILNLDENVKDFLVENLDISELQSYITYLGSLRFTWEEINGPISELSYGQRAKLIILKMILEKKKVLILDEPTRNLSVTSNPVIREILKNYKGCIVSVSHDRKFLNEVCSRVYRLEREGLKNFI